MSDEIEIVPYDPAWPQMFETERERLVGVLGTEDITDIVHFGSTAVPNLPAKPIIDILIVTPSLSTAKIAFPSALQRLEYVFWADNPKSDRLFFVKGMPPYGTHRTHHVHVAEPGSEMTERLIFGDYLRSHSDACETYAKLKAELANRYHDDREAYTKAKSAFITDIIMRAQK